MQPGIMSHTEELCSVDPERCIQELDSSTLVPAASGNKSRCSHHQNRVITNPAPYIRSFWGWGWGSPRGCACDCSTCRRGCRFPASTFAMGWRLGWEVPPDTGSVFRYVCQVPSASGGIKSQATAVTDLQQPLKGIQDGDQGWGTLYPGQNWQNRP